MCNPPFYGAAAEVSSSQSAKALAPFAVRPVSFRQVALSDVRHEKICTGGEAEMITPGGEVAFVGRIVSESVALSARIRSVSLLLRPQVESRSVSALDADGSQALSASFRA